MRMRSHHTDRHLLSARAAHSWSPHWAGAVIGGKCRATILRRTGFKLIVAAQSSWHRLDGQNQLLKVITGVAFAGGVEAGNENAAA
jgi:hypothetical protein